MKVNANDAAIVAKPAADERPGFLRRVGGEVKAIWLLSSHGHTHGDGPGQHQHGPTRPD